MKARNKGELVRATFQGKTVVAQVVRVSTTGAPLLLRFDAMLGGYMGWMPVLEADGALHDLFCSEVVTIEDLKPGDEAL